MINISCEQFETLMSFYFNDDLSEYVRKSFEKNISTCQFCQQKYILFVGIIKDLKDSYNHLSHENVSTKTLNGCDLYSNISAYVDNELTDSETIKLKKMIISKPEVRDKIEKMYNLKKTLKNSFEQVKPQKDYSKIILNKLGRETPKLRGQQLAVTLLGFIVLCLIWGIMLLSAISI